MNIENSKVARYTIDNCYGDSVVTLVRAELAAECTRFTDEPECWEDETVITECPDIIAKELHVAGGGPVAEDFQPGRVFLRGQFKLVETSQTQTGFEVDQKAPETWLRIDQLPMVRENIKQLYSDLLAVNGRSD